MNSSTSTSDNSRRFICIFLLAWLCLLCAPALLVLIVDPYHVFHRSIFSDQPFYKDNERYQVAGIIHHDLAPANPDSLVVGTSLSSNFTAAYIQKYFGWQAVNLSIRASTLSERTFVLEEALRSSNIKQVIFEINPADIGDGGVDVFHDPDFPLYLYQPGYTNKTRYLFNYSVASQSIALLMRNCESCNKTAQELGLPYFKKAAWGFGIEQWNEWLRDAEDNQAFTVFNTPERQLAMQQELDRIILSQGRDTWEWQNSFPFENIHNNLVAVIKKHPEIEFRIWFGAVSLYRYAGEDRASSINMYVALRRTVTNELAQLPNVRIYSFDNDKDIVGDMRNYMDSSHFSRSTLEYILSEMSKDTHRLQPETIDAFCEQFRQNIFSFKIKIPETTLNSTQDEESAR